MNTPPQHNKRTFFGIASFQALAMFRRGLFYSYLSIYLRFFLGLSVTETTFFATFPMLLNIIFQTFVWGVLSDKYQKRRTYIILGEVFAALSTVVVWWLHTIPSNKYTAGYIIILGLSFVEIFWSMSNIGWSAIISDLYPERSRTSVQGMLASIGAVGRIIGVWIGGIAYDGLTRYYDGWGFHSGVLFFIASAIMLLSTIPMFFVPEGGIDRSQDTPAEKAGSLFSITKPFLVFLLAMLFVNFGKNSIAIIKNQYLVLDEGFNVSSSLLSYVVNMRSLAMFVFGILIARLSRRFNDTLLLGAGICIGLLYLLGFVFAHDLTLIFIANFLGGVSDVVIMASSYSYAARLIPPKRRGKQFALFNATFFLSWGVAGTLIAGPIVDLLVRSGASQVFSYQMSFLSAACLVIVGFIIFLLAHSIVKRSESNTRDNKTIR
jgi:MFS family permease